MKKIEYMKPAMRVKVVMYEAAPLCESLTKDPEEEVDPEGGGGWAKDYDDDFEYPTGGNVWED